jgi:hypothetical protein
VAQARLARSLLLIHLLGLAGCADDSAAEARSMPGDGAAQDGVPPEDAGADGDFDAGLDADGDDSGLVLPAITRPLWLGYFKVSGRYGDYTLEATLDAGNCACVFANQGDFDLVTQDPISMTANAAADLATLDAAIVIAGGPAEISAAVPYWSQVVTLYVTGEATGASPLDPAPCEQQAAVARAHVHSLGIPNRPILCYFDTDISDDPQGIWHDPIGVDWIGINAYLGPAAPPTSEQAVAELRDRIGRQLARLPASRPVIIMAQAYDRNGAWTDIPMLERLQPIYLEEAQLDSRIKGIWWFSYSRPGGTLTHPSLRPWHEAVFRANVMGRPPIESPP